MRDSGCGKCWAIQVVIIILAASGAAYSYLWETLDDLIFDELVMFAIVANEAPIEQNPVPIPMPNWLKDRYWERKGRLKLSIQLRISPEARMIAEGMLGRAVELEWVLDPDRVAELRADLARVSSETGQIPASE